MPPLLSLTAVGLRALYYRTSPLGVLNRLTPTSTYQLERDVPYTAAGGLHLDVYRPIDHRQGNAAGNEASNEAGRQADHQADHEGRAPVVVFFYGGSWQTGSRSDYRFVGEALAAAGIVAVIPDYRLYPAATYPGFLSDCARAVAWTVAEIGRFGGDPETVIVAGHSAGAYNAAMVALDPRWLAPLGLHPERVAGLIGLAGPYNFLPIKAPDLIEVFGGAQPGIESQPVAHVSPAAPRTLLIAARRDKSVYTDRNTEVLAERLAAAGAPVDVRVFRGVTHETLVGAIARPLRGLAPVLPEILRFTHAFAAAKGRGTAR